MCDEGRVSCGLLSALAGIGTLGVDRGWDITHRSLLGLLTDFVVDLVTYVMFEIFGIMDFDVRSTEYNKRPFHKL